MKRTTASFALFAAMLQIACQSTTQIHEIFREAHACMESRPDSALSMLRSVDRNALHTPSLRARYALLYSRALDKNYIDLQSDSVIAPAVAYYSRRGCVRDRAYANYYWGCISYNKGDVDETVRLMIASEVDAKSINDSYLLGQIYCVLGNLYQSQYSFSEALAMYERAQRCFQGRGDFQHVASIHESKAIVYSMTKDHHSAELEYRRALHLFDSLQNRPRVFLLTRCLAYELCDSQSISADSLKKLLYDTYSCHSASVTPETDYALWAWIHFQEHDLDSARYYCCKALEGMQEPINRRCGLLVLLCKIEEQAANFERVASYWTEYHKLYEEIVKKEKEQLVEQAERKYHNRELSFENEKLHLHNSLAYCVGLFAVIALAFIFVLILQRRRRIIRQKSDRIAYYRQYIDVLKEEYSDLDARCKSLAASIDGSSSAETNLLKALKYRLKGLEELLDMAYTGNRKPADFFNAFKEYAAAMGDGDEAFSDLQYFINRSFYGMVDYLRVNYPALSNSELNLLCMLQFGFSFDSIRLLYNHENVDSLYSRRTKIREKLQLPARYKLERFLAELTDFLKDKSSAC